MPFLSLVCVLFSISSLTIVKLTKQNKTTTIKSKEINREIGTNTHKQTNRKQNKQRNTQKHSRFRNNRISVLVVLVLLLQHPVLVLIFKQRLHLSFARWLGSVASFFFLSFSSSSSLSEVWHFKFVYCPQVPESAL
jgi:uncharacterized membrane protein